MPLDTSATDMKSEQRQKRCAKLEPRANNALLAQERRRRRQQRKHRPAKSLTTMMMMMSVGEADAGERLAHIASDRHLLLPTARKRAAIFQNVSLWLLCCSALASLLAEPGLAMDLPDGIENILGFVPRSTFKCERDGYFGDIDNDCRLFHLCQRQAGPNGRPEWRHWTYACGNQTMFNQLTLTCAFVDEAIPCRHASQFQYLNEVIHKPAEPFLTDADVTSGFSYYSNRIMSDGARQRAFEDSQLLAQIGGQAQPAEAAANQQQLNSFAFNSFADEQLNQALNQWSASNFAPPTQPQASQQFVSASASHQQAARSQPDPAGHQNSFQFHFRNQHQVGNQPEARQFNQFSNADSQPAPSGRLGQQSELGGAIAPASSDERQTFSAPASSAATNDEHQNNQANNQIQFEYSITTNHQPNLASEPANVIFRQQSQPQTADLNSRQFGQTEKVPTPTTTPTTTTTPSTTTSAVQPTTAAATTPASEPKSQQASTQQSPQLLSSTTAPLVPTFASSQRLKTTTLTVLTTTTASSATSQQPTATTRGPSESQRQKRRPTNAEGTNQQVAPRRSSNSVRTLRAGFQSNRLSGQQAHKKQAEATPIVMRASRSEAAGPSSARSASPLVSPLDSAQVASWLTGGDFWRRPFDSQLITPKFESLLLRRRV